jgi:hypothetical protein
VRATVTPSVSRQLLRLQSARDAFSKGTPKTLWQSTIKFDARPDGIAHGGHGGNAFFHGRLDRGCR